MKSIVGAVLNTVNANPCRFVSAFRAAFCFSEISGLRGQFGPGGLSFRIYECDRVHEGELREGCLAADGSKEKCRERKKRKRK